MPAIQIRVAKGHIVVVIKNVPFQKIILYFASDDLHRGKRVTQLVGRGAVKDFLCNKANTVKLMENDLPDQYL